MATQRSRKYPESNRSTLAILFDKRMPAYTLEILPPGSNWSDSVSFVKIVIAPARQHCNKDCQASNRDTNTDQEVPQKRSFDGKCTDNSFSTTQRSSTRSTTAGSVSRPRSTSSSSRRPFGEISTEAASTSSKAPLVGVLADRSLLRRLSVYDFYAAAKAQPRPRVVLYLQEGSPLFLSTLNSILENVSHFKATTLLVVHGSPLCSLE
jgi:hypothetical protein